LDEKPNRDFRWAWTGAVAGLAMLSKLTTVGFVFATAVTVVGTSRNWQAVTRRFGWFAFGVISTAGWWFVRNVVVYGYVFALVEDGYQFNRSPFSWAHARQSAITIFKTFWAVFGRVNEHYFPDIYRFYWWFASLAALGIIFRYLFYRGKLPDIPQRLMNFFVVAIGASILATMYYAHNYNSDQGRYLFPVLIPITTFITVGLNAIAPQRYRRLVLVTVLFSFAAINAIVLARLTAVYGHTDDHGRSHIEMHATNVVFEKVALPGTNYSTEQRHLDRPGRAGSATDSHSACLPSPEPHSCRLAKVVSSLLLIRRFSFFSAGTASSQKSRPSRI
jgi:hypothetical protein